MVEDDDHATRLWILRALPVALRLCVGRGDGRLVAVEPDPSHPTGANLCVKGRAAPELVYAPDRLLHPMRRTRPKGDPDAGWVRIGWDEALRWTAERMRVVADRDGPEARWPSPSPRPPALRSPIGFRGSPG